MTAIVRIPTPLRVYANGQTDVPVDAVTVGGALAQLVDRFPQLRDHLYADDGRLRNFVAVYLNDEDARHLGGDGATVKNGDTIMIVPSVAGGLERRRSVVERR